MSVTQSPDVDTRVDEQVMEDLRPPCDFYQHDTFGDGPAEWVIWFKDTPVPCCGKNPEGQNPMLFCTPCKEAVMAARWFRCDSCHGAIWAAGWIVRVEPL